MQLVVRRPWTLLVNTARHRGEQYFEVVEGFNVAKQSSQKFIGRNRAPRVQIEYDVEVYGSEKTIQLPFVMGVMADLSGKPEDPLEPVDDRKFLEIDVDNFDDRLKAMKPRVAFPVPNTLTGEGNVSVDVTFESMDDFSPAAVARKIEPLRKLLEARTQLSNLMTWMDGKSGAEDLITKLLQDSSLLGTLTSAPKPADPEPTPEPAASPDVESSEATDADSTENTSNEEEDESS